MAYFKKNALFFVHQQINLNCKKTKNIKKISVELLSDRKKL